ncbi:MAG: RDD family protein [Pseudomonadales bacterium]|nr:RDD family protein [Pseudomonadales bacterium]MCP5214937.1 RDD family protein [Pseudomonadales bacterium]
MDNNLEYAGFWIRTAAALIDTILMLTVIFPVLTLIYGKNYWLGESLFLGFWDLLFNYVLPATVVILFWIAKSATPGKMLFKLIIIDEKTGGKPSVGQLIGRYLGYYVSMLPLMLGIIWVGIDQRKQGWHDKLAGTLVVKSMR